MFQELVGEEDCNRELFNSLVEGVGSLTISAALKEAAFIHNDTMVFNIRNAIGKTEFEKHVKDIASCSSEGTVKYLKEIDKEASETYTPKKNWFYTYHNLQESFKELNTHLKRIDKKFVETSTLDQNINQGIQFLLDHIKNLREVKTKIDSPDYGISLETKTTQMLLKKFLNSAETFTNEFNNEMEVNCTGFINYLEEGC